MIEQNQYKQYKERLHEIKETIDGQLENMGFDIATKKKEINKIKNYVGSALLLGGHFFIIVIPNLVSSVSNALKNKDDIQSENFVREIKSSFSDYIETLL